MNDQDRWKQATTKAATLWTSDLTAQYVHENSAYST